jgi:hypothetical protein
MKALKSLFVAAVLMAAGAATGLAQVKRVEMKIDGYLCGN